MHVSVLDCLHKFYYLYTVLDPSCNKYCDLIGQEQVSISHINL